MTRAIAHSTVLGRQISLLLFVVLIFIGTSQCASPQEIEALTDLYNSCSGSEWIRNANWLNGHDPCVPPVWDGVYCSQPSASSNIYQLSLTSNNLRGSIPASIGQLTSLKYLKMSNNTITGSIPPEIGNIYPLEWIELDRNQLTGTIPAVVLNSTNLHEFYVQNNNLTGTIPDLGKFAPHLYHFHVEYNGLSGTFPGSLLTESIQEVNLAHNFFEGKLPDNWEYATALKGLWTNNNNFNGTLPPFSDAQSHLKNLDLSYNSFGGAIPSSWKGLTALTNLYLENNYLVSTLPSWLGNLPISYLNLNNNLFTGSIPASLNNVRTLLYLSNNRLSGYLPTFLQTNPTYLRNMVDLRRNEFFCPLPSWCHNSYEQGICDPCVESQSCCAVHGGPGCSDEGVERCVCLGSSDPTAPPALPSCCAEGGPGWTAECVAAVSASGCGACGTGDCCQIHDQPGCMNLNVTACVCKLDPYCCTGSWDSKCVETMMIDTCSGCSAYGTDCCKPHERGGCAVASVESCVCTEMPECCIGLWTAECVEAVDSLFCGSCA